MNRRNFLTISGTGLLAMTAIYNKKSESVRMPALFIGHGSPMNALANTSFTQHLTALGQTLPRPKKILMISAHWMTKGVKLAASVTPKTIYDFYGFPEPLYQIKYPAPGDPSLAENVSKELNSYQAGLDFDWGLDHGAWSVLHHMYPKADIPVMQLSLNDNFMNLKDHYQMASELKKLRDNGVLIIGSGNIVHNLREISRVTNAPVMDWAKNFDEMIKTAILNNDLRQFLGEDSAVHSLWKIAHPSIEHYLPLLYILGAAETNEKILFPYEAFENGSLSMRSVLIG